VGSRYSESMSVLDDSSFERLIKIQSYTDEELKSLAVELTQEEQELSMRRRLLHGELDIVRAEMVRRLRDKNRTGTGIVQDGDVAALSAILSSRGGSTGEPLGEE
jgi:RsiG-like